MEMELLEVERLVPELSRSIGDDLDRSAKILKLCVINLCNVYLWWRCCPFDV